MREIAEFELSIQGGTEKIESLGTFLNPCLHAIRLTVALVGEAGEVEESMKELAAVEALKIEKAEKEVPLCQLI